MNRKGTKYQIVKNTLTGWLAVGCKAGISLVMVPFLLKSMGRGGYGLIGLIGAIVAFSTVADLGLRAALGRELSEKVAKGDVIGFRTLSTTALALYAGIATVLIVVGWGFAPWIVAVFKVTDNLRFSAIWLIRIYGSATLLLSFVTPVFTAGLQSFLRFDAINLMMTLTSIASGILLFLCISISELSPLVIWALVVFSTLLCELLCLIVMHRKWCFEGKLGVQYFHIRELKSLFRLGGSMYVLQLCGMLAMKTDPLVVSYFYGICGVAIYDAGSKISSAMAPVVMTLSTQVHPLTTRYHVLNEQQKQKEILFLGTRYTLYIGIAASIGILIFAERFCRLWLFDTLNSDYLTVARVMQLWAVANIFNYAGSMHWPVTLGAKKMRFALALQIPSSIFNIICSIILVGYTSLGIPGVLVGTIVTEAIRRPFAAWYVARICGSGMREYFRSGYLPPLYFLLLIAFPGYIALGRNSVSGWLQLVMLGGLYGFYALIVLSILEYKMIRRLIGSLKNRNVI